MMLSKRPHQMIGKLSDLLVAGNRAGVVDVATSPRSPLEFKIKSPRGLKNYDLGGVGLGIVAALGKSSDGRHEILARYSVCSSNLNRSEAIPVNSGKNRDRYREGFEDLERDSLENYTYVTCHGPNKSFTKVYYDGDLYGTCGHERNGFDKICNNKFGDSRESPVRVVEENSVFRTSEFLSSCHLCRKQLHGKDIYMYRGEKAFCSTECRSRQIMIDERKERCRSEAVRSDVSSSPYTRGQIFSAGILAI